MSELKPCPFCGGRATVKTRYIGYGSIGLGEHDEYRVVCKECRASSDEYRHEAEAIAAWNRRADVVPVVRGKWDADPCGWHCSECGADGRASWHYCPNCGKQLKGVEGK